MRESALLMLEDGTYFEGYKVGVTGTTTGEICFNTGMTGYQEIYTDPSYYGQIIINTTSHIGNYGTLSVENESTKVQFTGLICNSFAKQFSRRKSDLSLSKYFEQHQVVGIEGIDTRRLVRYIRQKGAMNAIISSEIKDLDVLRENLVKVPSMNGLELSTKVTTKEVYFEGDPNAEFKVAVLDLGIKSNILRNLVKIGAYCKVFPATTSYEEMKSWKPSGYFISNGPGDPSVMEYAIQTVRHILADNAPLFGICLGHQILALASGLSTYKMHNGHRGLNHPVKNLVSGKSEITSQNHGFAVRRESMSNNTDVQITHINLNDDTIEGIRLRSKNAFSVQYHPEAAPGPHDSEYLFEDFRKLLKK